MRSSRARCAGPCSPEVKQDHRHPGLSSLKYSNKIGKQYNGIDKFGNCWTTTIPILEPHKVAFHPRIFLIQQRDITWASWFPRIPTSSHLIIRMPNKSTDRFLLNISINKKHRNYAVNNTIRYLLTNISTFSNYKLTKFQRGQMPSHNEKNKLISIIITSFPTLKITLMYSKHFFYYLK